MPAAIETRGLSKRFGDVPAVVGVDLRVERGEVYAFLGLNGAGKTTTIRARLGMARPTAGTITLLGERVGAGGRGPWRRVGHLVETPAAYPELTVYENLELVRRRPTWTAARFHLGGSKCYRLTHMGLMGIMMGLDARAERSLKCNVGNI